MAGYKMDLSGLWDFQLDAGKRGIEEKWYASAFEDTISLPGTTAQSRKGEKNHKRETGYLTEPWHFEGYAWYARKIAIPGEHRGDMAMLTLERTRISYVWVDGRFVGSRDSFACAHRYDLTAYLAGAECAEHRLTVMVSNVDYKTAGGHMTSPDTQTNWNGILGGIFLTLEPLVRIEGLTVTASAVNRKLRVEFSTVFNKDLNVQYRISCRKKGSAETLAEEIFEEAAAFVEKEREPEEDRRKETGAEDDGMHSINLDIPTDREIALWNEYEPNLYELTVEVYGDGDSVSTANGCDVSAAGAASQGGRAALTKAATVFGFRDLRTEGRAFYLNDLPVMLRGKHDGMIFPLTGYAPMEKEEWRRIFRIAKAYGINHYRFHTCCPPEAAFAAADEEGIYLAPELPFWGTVAGEEETEAEREGRAYLLEEGFRILKEFGNHPSFLIFSLGNELWGNQEVLNDILAQYKAVDKRHWYVQGSNNFQFTPVILAEDDFFSGVRFSRERLFRGSYAMCDAPQGHVQVMEPENCYSYDESICPMEAVQAMQAKENEKTEKNKRHGENEKTEKAGQAEGTSQTAQEIEIQYQTGVKKVKAETGAALVPNVPVVSHEIGQYAVYPDYREIERYTGVLQPENLKIFRERLERKGMLPMAERFFRASGKLAVACYKRELETAFRSRELAGFQLLDLQDFTGQGTALVGILNAFMENKGLVTAKEWRQFCNDRILMLSFPTYIYQAGGVFAYEVLLCNMRPGEEQEIQITVTLTDRDNGTILAQQRSTDRMILTRLKNCGSGSLAIPAFTEPKILTASVCADCIGSVGSVDGTGAGAAEGEAALCNRYDIYVYPTKEQDTFLEDSDVADVAGMVSGNGDIDAEPAVLVTKDCQEMLTALDNGKKVLFFGSGIRGEYALTGTYCTDFWCYPMFASISKSMNRPLPIGTMGLCMEKEHPAFRQFPVDGYTTPQWWKIVTDTKLAVLDEEKIEPLVWMIDNFERNHKLGLVYEAKAGNGSLLVCQADLTAGDSPEQVWFYKSLLSYAASEAFAPEREISVEWLRKVY